MERVQVAELDGGNPTDSGRHHSKIGRRSLRPHGTPEMKPPLCKYFPPVTEFETRRRIPVHVPDSGAVTINRVPSRDMAWRR